MPGLERCYPQQKIVFCGKPRTFRSTSINHLWIIYLYLRISLSLYLRISLSLYLRIYLFVYLSCLAVCPFVYYVDISIYTYCYVYEKNHKMWLKSASYESARPSCQRFLSQVHPQWISPLGISTINSYPYAETPLCQYRHYYASGCTSFNSYHYSITPHSLLYFPIRKVKHHLKQTHMLYYSLINYRYIYHKP